MVATTGVSAVYGPVRSWRFGRSLGVDLLGAVSTCTYNCQYCQLGTIEQVTCDRGEFVPTAQVQAELAARSPADFDVVTFSGSGEPTLARNLGAVMGWVRANLPRPVVVLTNGTLLGDRAVQQDLALADIVALKLDAVSSDHWQTINRPAPELHLESVLQGMLAFRATYLGYVAVQTMVMTPWSKAEEQRYQALIQALRPHEVQLNTPLRSRPLTRQLEARGNVTTPDPTWRQPRHVTPATLNAMAMRLQAQLDLPVRHPYQDAPPPCSTAAEVA